MNKRQRKKYFKKWLRPRLDCPGGEVNDTLTIENIFKARDMLKANYRKSVSLPEWMLGKRERIFI